MTVAEPVGLARRSGAIFYDLVILAALLIGATALVLPLTRAAIAPGTLWFQAYLGGIALAYFAGFWWRRGQTVGMAAWRLRLVNREGGAVSAAQALVRALIAMLSIAAVGLGFVAALFDHERRTWHDRASATRLERY